MVRDDVQLIHEILAGDDAAFNTLVQKYQKRVHALAWRKIGDFHHAEEITQDTFLQVYRKLATLKDPNQFAGWLYVIANRVCIAWLRKRKPTMQSLADTPMEEIEQSSHTHYVSEQRETEANAYNAELVKKLLKKLPESERTVMTLYYLGEMTTKEIGNFLGVSANTITSRLQRARKRLQKEQELLAHEVLSGVQISANLSQNIMEQITDIKPTPPLAPKPFLPWTALGAAAILILLLLGMSNRYLVRFQKPYSFEAASEPTIEIVDTALILDMDSKPDVRNQLGRAGAIGKKNNTGLQASETLLTSDAQRDSRILSTSQWTQATGPQGSDVFNIFATSEGILYAAAPTGIYRLSVGAPAWTLIDTDIPIGSFHVPIAEHRDTLYIVSTDKIFASTDTGETWNIFCPRPKGHTVGLIITDETRGISSQADITMYLAFQDKGVFRSTAVDGQWDPLNDGLTGKRIYAVAAVENTVFIGTNEGLYHLNSGVWEEVPVTTQSLENKVIANTNSDF
ncbi:MAG: sigma-70 family RNA polymerase sigma factor, partial [Candidatus Poribacteria bacterium]|nr:sigma-70 family RNA polymerase sigma factor [Candidatus Poribacteria bacterium]